MTNGEKIKEIFPDTKIITQYDNPSGDRFIVFTLNNEDMQVNIDINWWNAEYKESTTTNDIAVAEMIRLVRESDVIDRTDGSVLAKAFNYLFDRYIEEPTAKNYLVVSSELEKNSKKLEKNFGELDCISRADARKAIIDHQYSVNFCEEHNIDHSINTSMALIALSDLPSVTPQEPCNKYEVTFKDDNAVSRLSVRDIIYANAYELEYPDSTSEYVVNRDELIKYLMELPSVYPKMVEP